jgi:hypothetical protein
MRQHHSEKGSLLHVIRRQPKRLLALAPLGLLMAAVFASAATPQPGDTYTPTVTPATATAGVNESFTVTITNDSSSTAVLGSANITPPAGWDSIK